MGLFNYNQASQSLLSQGSEGSCTIHAIANAIELWHYNTFNTIINLSTDGIYNRLTQDEKNQIDFIQANKAIRRAGGFSCVNYIGLANLINTTINIKVDTDEWGNLLYERLLEAMRGKIINGAKIVHSVVIAIPTIGGFSNIDNKTFLSFNVNKFGKTIRSGMHAVGVVDIEPNGDIRCANSWGESWGNDGTFWIKREDIKRISRDVKFVKVKK